LKERTLLRAALCREYHLTWADTSTLRLWEVRVLVGQLEEENRSREQADKQQSKAAKRPSSPGTKMVPVMT